MFGLAAWHLEFRVTKRCCYKGLHSSDLLRCLSLGFSANFSNIFPLIYESNLKVGYVPSVGVRVKCVGRKYLPFTKYVFCICRRAWTYLDQDCAVEGVSVQETVNMEYCSLKV